MRWRAGLVTLGVCGLCFSAAARCKPIYLGDLYSGEIRGAGGAGAGGAGAVTSANAGGTGGGSQAMSSTSGEDACPGACLPSPKPSPWRTADFVLLWIGPTDQQPMYCPLDAPTEWWNGYTDLVQATCPQCTCLPPKGSCELPATLSAYYTSTCPPPPNTPFQSFDAPAGWAGACTPVHPVAADPACVGNNCIQELTIDPLILKDPPACEPGVATPDVQPAHWGSSARMCLRGQAYWQQCGPDQFCAPTPGNGFMACIQQPITDKACPEGWPNRFVLAHTFADTSACAPCTCGAPTGSKCETSISAYTMASDCTGSHITALVDSTKASCNSVLAGSGLLSKLADPPVYSPGTCAAMGGELSGTAIPDKDDAYTVCCM